MARVVEESIHSREVQVRRKLVKRSQHFVVFQVDVRQDFEVVLPQGLCEFVHVIFGAAEVEVSLFQKLICTQLGPQKLS